MWLCSISKEELTGITVWAVVSHRKNTASGMLKSGKKQQCINMLVLNKGEDNKMRGKQEISIDSLILF